MPASVVIASVCAASAVIASIAVVAASAPFCVTPASASEVLGSLPQAIKNQTSTSDEALRMDEALHRGDAGRGRSVHACALSRSGERGSQEDQGDQEGPATRGWI